MDCAAIHIPSTKTRGPRQGCFDGRLLLWSMLHDRATGNASFQNGMRSIHEAQSRRAEYGKNGREIDPDHTLTILDRSGSAMSPSSHESAHQQTALRRFG